MRFLTRQKLEFTPLEFETSAQMSMLVQEPLLLEFTPLEFETLFVKRKVSIFILEFTPLEFETEKWNDDKGTQLD